MLLVKTKRSCLSICWHFSGKVVIILLLITFILLRNIITVLLISDLCEVISVNILHFSCKEVDNLQQLLRIAQMFGLGGHGGGVFSQNLHMYLSKYLPVFIKILTCIYQNPNLYFLKSVPVFLKIFTCISQNLYLYFSKSLPVFLKIFTCIVICL